MTAVSDKSTRVAIVAMLLVAYVEVDDFPVRHVRTPQSGFVAILDLHAAVELYYRVPDLGLVEPGITHGHQGTLFTGHVAAFDLVRERGMRDKYFVVHPTGWDRRLTGG